MSSVIIAGKKIWVDRRPVALMGGEVHYWRLDPRAWRPVLERVRELGAGVLATYICWDFHQQSPGEFDFTGQTDPRRNLTAFLDLAQEVGFDLFVRPGPYIYSEWKNAGVPDEAAQFHRLDPRYLQMARRWLAAAVGAFSPYLATRGGRIVLVQAENESDCWPHIYTEDLGLGRRPGLFQRFLQARYGEISALNSAWHTRYKEFEEARAVMSLPPEREDLRARYHDFYRFKHWYVMETARWSVGTLRELGVDVPVAMNVIASHANEPWAEMETVADIVGLDPYPSRYFSASAHEHRHFLEHVRTLSGVSRLPYLAEFEAGYWHGSGAAVFPPGHYRLAVLSALMAGAAGWNWYMLGGRDNWVGSPINEWGRIRPDLFRTFQGLANLYHRLDPPALERWTPLAVTLDPLREATGAGQDDLLQALYAAGLDYGMVDVNRGECSAEVLFYSGGAWLSSAGQERLLEYVRRGGHLVCCGSAPRLDDALRPHDGFDLPQWDGIVGDFGPIDLDVSVAGTTFRVASRFLAHCSVDWGEPVRAVRRNLDENAGEEMAIHCALPEGQAYTVGFTRQVGEGRLTLIGLQPSAALVEGLLGAFGVIPPVRARPAGVQAALFRRGDGWVLLAVNPGDRPVQAVFELSAAAGKTVSVHDLTGDAEWGGVVLETGQISAPLGAYDGLAYQIRLDEGHNGFRLDD